MSLISTHSLRDRPCRGFRLRVPQELADNLHREREERQAGHGRIKSTCFPFRSEGLQ